jgi:hypothetical protein
MFLPFARNYQKPEVSELGFIFFFPPPSRLSKKDRLFYQENICFHIQKPDSDNLSKFYMDCMEDLFFDRDSSVVIKYSIKIIHPDYTEPQTVIRIFPKNIALTTEDLNHYGICLTENKMQAMRDREILHSIYA